MIHIGARVGVVVHAHDGWTAPDHFAFASVFVSDREFVLTTEPPLVIVPELKSPSEIIEDSVITVVVDFFDVKKCVKVRMTKQRTPPGDDMSMSPGIGHCVQLAKVCNAER